MKHGGYTDAESKMIFSIALKAITAKEAQKENPKVFKSLLRKLTKNTDKNIHEALSEITIE